jgi:hypothetical protein
MGFEAIQHDEKEHTKREKRKTNREWTRMNANKNFNPRLYSIHGLHRFPFKAECREGKSRACGRNTRLGFLVMVLAKPKSA